MQDKAIAAEELLKGAIRDGRAVNFLKGYYEYEQAILYYEGVGKSKEAMNLALGLERLSLQEMVKDRIREITDRLTRIDGQVRTLSRKMDEASPRGSQTTPKTPLPSPTPSPESQPNSQQIEEQSIQ